MHKEILTSEQNKLLPLVASFSKDFGLVGGTAIALHLGHRRSIDFDPVRNRTPDEASAISNGVDLFSKDEFGNQSLLNKISVFGAPDEIIVNKLDELTLVIKGVKLTFFHYPYKIAYSESFGYQIKIPDLLTLAAMKAFALGQRAKWKDYVDLYFIIKDHFSISQISEKGREIFGNLFNEKLFRSQLSYFEGINYNEVVEFLPGLEILDEIIKKKLTEFSIA
ncbi:MAG: nucleotidyl transferase AbiEii/AbiGii toxin family protein [Candidatus Paceibacterota bacterium]